MAGRTQAWSTDRSRARQARVEVTPAAANWYADGSVAAQSAPHAYQGYRHDYQHSLMREMRALLTRVFMQWPTCSLVVLRLADKMGGCPVPDKSALRRYLWRSQTPKFWPLLERTEALITVAPAAVPVVVSVYWLVAQGPRMVPWSPL